MIRGRGFLFSANALRKPLYTALVAFIFAGYPAGLRAEVVDRIVAIINESVITLSELNAATAVSLDKLEGADKKDSQKIVEVKGRVLEDLIDQKLVKQASDKAGIDISEREIDNAVDDIKKQNNMTQDSLLLALAQNGLTYREYREQLKEQIRQVKFINKEIRAKISILPEDVEDYYRQNKDEFYGPAAYRLNIIFIPSSDKETHDKKLKIIQEGLAKGEDFAELARREYSEGTEASGGGDMGFLKSGEMNKTMEETARKLKKNEISAPFSTQEGTYIIQLVDSKPPVLISMEDARGQITDKLYKKFMDERFKFWLKETKKTAHVEIRL